MLEVKRTSRLLGLLAIVMLASCSATGYAIADLAVEINSTRDNARTVVAVGDTIHVVFPFKAEWNHECQVQADGSASFRLVDNVQVAGLSIADLDSRLTELYRKKRAQEDVELTVDVLSAAVGATGADNGQVLYVVGEVDRPGAIAIVGRALTLVEAISAAGGHKKASANLRNTVLVRRLGSSGEMRAWRLDADIYSWGSSPPIYLQARDIVFVPNTAIDDINIWVDKYIRQMIPLPYLVPTV